jgi:hypothetical protein
MDQVDNLILNSNIINTSLKINKIVKNSKILIETAILIKNAVLKSSIIGKKNLLKLDIMRFLINCLDNLNNSEAIVLGLNILNLILDIDDNGVFINNLNISQYIKQEIYNFNIDKKIEKIANCTEIMKIRQLAEVALKCMREFDDLMN